MNTRFSKNKIFVLLKVLLIICITIQLHCSLDVCKPGSASRLEKFDIQEEGVADNPRKRKTWPDEDYDKLYFNSLKGPSYVYLPGDQLANGISESDYPLELQNNIGTPDKMNSIARPAELKTHNQKSPNDVTQNCFQQCNSIQDNKAIIDFSKLGYKTEPIAQKHDTPDNILICFTFNGKREYFPYSYMAHVTPDASKLFHLIEAFWDEFLALYKHDRDKRLEALSFDLEFLTKETDHNLTPEQIYELKSSVIQVILLEHYRGYGIEILNKFLHTLKLDCMSMSVFYCDPCLRDFIKKLIMNKVRCRLEKESKNDETASQNQQLKDSNASDITTQNGTNTFVITQQTGSNSNGMRNHRIPLTSKEIICKPINDELIAMRNIKEASEYFEP